MKLIVGNRYVDKSNRVWLCNCILDRNVYMISYYDGIKTFRATCIKGEFIDMNSIKNTIIRKLPVLIVGKVYLDNNGQPWKYNGAGAIQRGVRHKAQYIGPIVNVHQTGLLYGYDHLHWGDIWLTDTQYFPIAEGETFKDNRLFRWVAVQKYANGYCAKRIDDTNVMDDKDYPIIGTIHWDGVLRITNNGKHYELNMNRLHDMNKCVDWLCTQGEEIYVPKDNSELVNEVICELEKRYVLVPKKENINILTYPMIAKFKINQSDAIIAILKAPIDGLSEAIILDPSVSQHKVGDTIQTNPNYWVKLEETFHMKNT